jgi:hypothetical protein
MAKFNKTNASAGIPSSNDIRTQQASVHNENAQKSEYAQRFATNTQSRNAPTQLNKQELSITRLRFPDDLGIYYMGFQFLKYDQTNLKTSPKKSIVADIALPPPPNLIDILHQRYEETQTGLLGGAVQEALRGNWGNSATALALGAIAAGASTMLEAKGGNTQQAANLVRQTINYTARAYGASFNPFLAVFYVSPSFKQHEFVWRISPRTPEESNTVRDIIKAFHQRMSPTLEVNGIFFGYPDIVVPKLYCGDTEAEYLFEFKACVVENCIVNYAPNGVPSFFAGTRAPTDIEFRLSLKEIDLWIRSDYDGETSQF